MKKADLTVLHNGLIIHNRQELIGHTPYRNLGNYDRPHPPKGPIELYYHGNPLRFRKDEVADWDATVDKMLAAAKRFDAAKIQAGQIARSGGPAAEE